MPTTFSDIVPVRRVAVGDCSGPMGSGFDALARSAHAALLAAEWTQSADPPFLPVHDNGQTANRTIPRGDAWKCSYGYDADARTERSACGAVCYTFALPADAYSGTPANITTVALRLTGDRYLDLGVDLHIIPSASPNPPTVATLSASAPYGTYCATSGQSPTPPNERQGVTEAVSATLGVTAQPYLHVALLLHDYDTNRGAWIEGGAMLEGANATVSFSRDVQITPAPAAAPFVAPLYIQTAEDGNIAINPLYWAFHYDFHNTVSTQTWMPLRALASGAAAEAARQLHGGAYPELVSATEPDLTGFHIWRPNVNEWPTCWVNRAYSASPNYVWSAGFVAMYDATTLSAGGTIGIAPSNTMPDTGETALSVLISAVEIDDVSAVPNFSDGGLYGGYGERGLGHVEYQIAASPSVDFRIQLPLTRPPRSRYVGIVVTPHGGYGTFAFRSEILDLS